MKNKE